MLMLCCSPGGGGGLLPEEAEPDRALGEEAGESHRLLREPLLHQHQGAGHQPPGD